MFYESKSLLPSVVRYVRKSPELQSLVSEGIVGLDPLGVPWVYRPSVREPYPPVTVENSGKAAICFLSYDNWTTPSTMHTLLYPNLHMYIDADRSRDVDGNPTANDAEDRARHIFDTLNPLFHDAGNNIRDFDGFRIISTVAQGQNIGDISDGDGLVRMDCTYNLVI